MNKESSYQIRIIGHREHFHAIRRLVHFVTLQQGVDEMEADVIERAVAEACQNGLYHEPADEENPTIEVEISLKDEMITTVVKNRGKAFNFDDIEPFNVRQNFLEYKNGGLGIPIMKAVMDEVSYERRSGNLNVVTLVKYLNTKAERREGEHYED
ncbi:MAG TPA: ATP-binding protein [bacterium]|nr:ATP-binding protein [bacterium]